MSLTDQIHESPLNSALIGILQPLIPAVVRVLIEEPQERLERLRCEVEVAINHRLDALDKLTAAPATDSTTWTLDRVQAERSRLRCLLGLLPLESTTALTYTLGLVRIDGRPGDYIDEPPAWRCGSAFHAHKVPEPDPEETTEQRIAREVRFALTGVDTFENEVATTWVPRPAVDAAASAIRDLRGRDVEVKRQPDRVVHDGDPWNVRDLLVVQPPELSEFDKSRQNEG